MFSVDSKSNIYFNGNKVDDITPRTISFQRGTTSIITGVIVVDNKVLYHGWYREFQNKKLKKEVYFIKGMISDPQVGYHWTEYEDGKTTGYLIRWNEPYAMIVDGERIPVDDRIVDLDRMVVLKLRK